ncbi:hypothetical protein NL676_023696 [Syzygium grande]|nr:hypothetical protein NL676_023696 [Syzygium grande]
MAAQLNQSAPLPPPSSRSPPLLPFSRPVRTTSVVHSLTHEAGSGERNPRAPHHHILASAAPFHHLCLIVWRFYRDTVGEGPLPSPGPPRRGQPPRRILAWAATDRPLARAQIGKLICGVCVRILMDGWMSLQLLLCGEAGKEQLLLSHPVISFRLAELRELSDVIPTKKLMEVSKPILYVFRMYPPPTDVESDDFLAAIRKCLHDVQ